MLNKLIRFTKAHFFYLLSSNIISPYAAWTAFSIMTEMFNIPEIDSSSTFLGEI